jgi:DNA-binding Lrp family transcriptional regulator
MAVKAYILIEASIGQVAQVAERVRTLPSVAGADVVAGPYDVIAIVNADTPDHIGQLVMEQIHSIAGVNYTMTCVVISG